MSVPLSVYHAWQYPKRAWPDADDLLPQCGQPGFPAFIRAVSGSGDRDPRVSVRAFVRAASADRAAPARRASLRPYPLPCITPPDAADGSAGDRGFGGGKNHRGRGGSGDCPACDAVVYIVRDIDGGLWGIAAWKPGEGLGHLHHRGFYF